MFYVTEKSAAGAITFLNPENIFISNHRVNEARDTIFTYELQISVDQSLKSSILGNVEIRAYVVGDRKKTIQIKKADLSSKNFLKIIDRQKIANALDTSLEKKIFARKFIDRPDLNQGQISFQFEIPGSKVSEEFTIEAADVRTSESSVTLSKIFVNHRTILQRYDLPSRDFYLTTCKNDNNRIYVSAATDDTVVGSFRFLLRNESGITFESPKFSQNQDVSIDGTKSAAAYFDVSDANQKYTVRAYPISRFFGQHLGNYREETTAVAESEKYLPFYLSSITDQTAIFSILYVGKKIKRVFLYRKSPLAIQRDFISYSDYGSGGAVLADSSRIPGLDYVYTVDYMDETGTMKTSPGEVIVESVKLDKLAKIKVTKSNKTQEKKSVKAAAGQTLMSFNVKIEYNTSTVYDEIIEDLKQLGLENLYSDDLVKMTNNLKPITRVLVSSISKTTGIESYIGVYPAGVITIPVDSGSPQIIRFEAAIRSVPEALESLTSAQDVISNNSFNQNSQIDLVSKLIGNKSKNNQKNFSSKFYSKSSIQNSTLKYGSSANIRDLGYYSGRTGIFYDVSVQDSLPNISAIKNVKIIETNKGYFAKWIYGGDTSIIDKFEIVLDSSTYLYSSPTKSPAQIFYLGSKKPTTIAVNPITTRETFNLQNTDQ